MKFHWILLLLVVCFLCPKGMAATKEQTELELRIRSLIAEYFPDAHISQENDQLSASHGTMRFTVHGHSKTGERAGLTYQVEGPNFEGFLFSLSVNEGKYQGQAVIPQTLREPYWETYIDRPPTEDGAGHYVINFSYGSRLNQNFKLALFQLLPNSRRSSTTSVPESETQNRLPAESTSNVLEGTLRVHPKFHYRYYIDGFGDGQECALFQADNQLSQIKPGSRVRVKGKLGSRFFGGDPNDPAPALVKTWIIYMDVQSVDVLK
ncbi:MAG: hypothetical protein KDA65_08095 [Planctomycetaceae bacterium]|nr:hypothetical protein [Planctomycetaceae bacterium]